MSEQAILKSLEELSEALVLAEPDDLPALAGIHTLFEQLEGLAAECGAARAAEAAKAAAALVERIIIEDVNSPAAAVDCINKTVAGLQHILRDGQPAESVALPVLDEEESEDDAAAQTAFELPAHIDAKIFSDFLARQGGVLEELESHILTLEKAEDADTLGAMKRLVHTLKGEAGMLGLGAVERLCHRAEDALGERPIAELIDPFLTMKDWLDRAMAAYGDKSLPPDPVEPVMAAFDPNGATEPENGVQQDEEEPPAEAKPLEGDPSLLEEFVQEATEHLDACDLHILNLENNCQDEEALNAVFRAFHTIKGVAGFIALDDVQALAHEAENLLDKARKNELQLNAPCIDVIFDAVDMLKQMIEQVRRALGSDGLLHAVPGQQALIRRLRAAASGEFARGGVNVSAEDATTSDRLGDILVEKGMTTEQAIRGALQEQRHPPAVDPIGEMLIKANLLSRTQLNEALEIQRTEASQEKLGDLLVRLGAVTEQDLTAVVSKQSQTPQQAKLGEILVKKRDAGARDVVDGLRTQNALRQGQIQVREAVKVDADRLDRLVDAIGELVIAESMVRSWIERSTAGSVDVASHLNQLDKITRELQEMGMGLRMVPVRPTFQKMARLVRDLAKKSGKSVDFVMVGEDTELDKSVVDKIGDPLVHMVRNAVDHGLEADSETRKKAGKSPTGRVELRAFHKGGSIHIEIQDDGRGLSREGILNKARERGLVQNTESMSDRDVWNLIFEPGFSTAQTITDVSGRGVGMDVVRRNIEALRGQIEIHTELGKGTLFSIRLPLTLAIIDGMVIRSGKERYIVPTLSIIRSIRPKPEDLATVVGKGEVLSLQGELLPLFRLSRLFGISGAEEDPTKGLVVVVEDEGRRVGLLTDELLGQQQTVIKSLGDAMKGIYGIAGGAIMPDGIVGLILDVSGLVKLATNRFDETPQELSVEAGSRA